MSELELRQAGLEELISTIKDNKGAQKIVEWHKKMEQCQLGEMKAKRQLARLEHQVNRLAMKTVTFQCVAADKFCS